MSPQNTSSTARKQQKKIRRKGMNKGKEKMAVEDP